MSRPVGRRDRDKVVVLDDKQAQRLYAKGHVGTPRSGGGLDLSLVEAAYAIRAGRLDVAGDWTTLINGHEATYLSYADLRERGLVVRHADGEGFDVWQRGEAPPAEPWFRFQAVSERDAIRGRQLVEWAEAGVVVGVADDDGAVTHYQCAPAAPVGSNGWPHGDARKAHALADRVFVPGGLRGDHAMGTPHGDDLLLSLTEAEALRKRGLLDLPELATEHQHHFARTLPVYEALRDAGVVAKSGFRFGTHLRGYSKHPDKTHAEWLIQCITDDDVLHWSELSRAVRLAHGVRKTFLVALGGRFVSLSWFRP